MSALKRQLLRGLCACAALVLACCHAPPADQSGKAYREWLAERVRAAAGGGEPRDAAVTAALRQHLCGADAECFPDAVWHALDARARRSDDPSVLSLMASVAERRKESDVASHWAEVAALDSDNASPLLAQAAAEWQDGRHAEALNVLRSALSRPRFDDGYTKAFKLILPIVAERTPALEEMQPCAGVLAEPADAPPDALERRIATTFEIVSDFAPQIGYFSLCNKQDNALESTQRELCVAAGTLIAEHATTVLGRGVGFAMQRLVNPDPAAQERIWAQQTEAWDEFLRQSWWVDGNPNAKQRAVATAFGVDAFLRDGELASAHALIQQFGEPPAESAEVRGSRYRAQMQQGQQCYARYYKRYNHEKK
jgi:hypothetical protein